MTVVDLLLRCAAALVVGDPGSGPLPLLTLGVLGLSVVSVALAVAVVVAAVLATVTALAGPASVVVARPPTDLVTRIGWSHPDADGHVRSRAPGVAATA